MQYWWGASLGAAALAGACLALPVDGTCHIALGIVVLVASAICTWRAPLPLTLVLATTCMLFALYARAQFVSMETQRESITQSFEAVVEGDEARDPYALLALRLPDGRHAECLSTTAARAGTVLRVRGRPTPFDGPRNPGESDERILARARHVDLQLAQCTIETRERRFVIDAGTLRGITLDWARSQLHAILPEPTASIAAGELWGERATLPAALHDEFQETGTVHILVTAGLHIGLAAACIAWAMRLLRAPRVIACVTAALSTLALLILSGAHLPAERAAIMTIVALAARCFGRSAISWNTFGIAVANVLALDPLQVLDASLWLSFCCVAAIFTSADALLRGLANIRVPHLMGEPLALAVATQLGTWPLTALVFLRFNLYAVVANAFIVPIVPLTMGASCCALLAHVLGLAPLALIASHAVEWSVLWITTVLDALAHMPGDSTRMASPPTWSVALYECTLLASPVLLRTGASMLAPSLVLLAALFCVAPPEWPDGRMRVDMLDVGQADAILVRTPSGKTMLVDAGGRLERGPDGQSQAEAIGSRIVVPALLHLGVTHVDVCVMTHPHGDHVAGFVAVMRDLGCGEILDGGQHYPGRSYHDVLALAAASRVPVRTIRDGAQLWLDPTVSLWFVGPDEPLIVGADAINDNSIAFILRYRSFRMFFTGDAGAAAEERFLARGSDMRCDVLKVGHHGSAHSSSPQFIAAVRPATALISVGRHNTFGHPASQTLSTLQHYDASIFRTDANGALEIVTDGRGALPAISAQIH